MTTRNQILEGMATILWASAWADHAEDHRCTRLSGCEITEIMPRIPRQARTLASTIAARIERTTGVTLDSLYDRACDACRTTCCRRADHTPRRFGECLAYSAMGAGVAWSDDHAADGDPAFPYMTDTGELMMLAEERCQ